ncbi:hypothetical protein HLB44_31630 [Aquincola sp. S2]|uniref:Uncharacterized protein n=1 Tax=Pseudaquabacterium terrae TaxID=2732868 RepID=A0ABX2ESD7_9BURK|nr:hypothetical protein [Aquabacterium terrae]
MKLDPFVVVGDAPFSCRRDDIVAARGQPFAEARNDVGLTELDYGDIVFRFQDNGRLEEITTQAPVLELDAVAVPFRSLEAFVQAQDPDAFRRAGFIVSPRFGLAFDPSEPCWITALARHCLAQWRAL